jgi:hypothetical protein
LALTSPASAYCITGASSAVEFVVYWNAAWVSFFIVIATLAQMILLKSQLHRTTLFFQLEFHVPKLHLMPGTTFLYVRRAERVSWQNKYYSLSENLLIKLTAFLTKNFAWVHLGVVYVYLMIAKRLYCYNRILLRRNPPGLRRLPVETSVEDGDHCEVKNNVP